MNIRLTPLKHIVGELGDVFHIMRKDSPDYPGFGEVYISTVKEAAIKGWKKHYQMTLNIVVPIGKILFVLYDECEKEFREIILSPENYQRLTVPPGTWMAFKGLAEGESLLVNFADVPHDPAEAEGLELINSLIPYEWK